MSKDIYFGVSNKARKINGAYIGIGGNARKITKGYIGVGNKARLFYDASSGDSGDSGSATTITFTVTYQRGTDVLDRTFSAAQGKTWAELGSGSFEVSGGYVYFALDTSDDNQLYDSSNDSPVKSTDTIKSGGSYYTLGLL